MAFGRLTRSPGSDRPRPMGEINMTPLIDVMLVLLVIFIIAAPLLGSSLRLDLPHVDAAQPSDAPLVVHVALDAQGRLHLDDVPLDEAALRARLAQTAAAHPQAEVQLRADRTVPYGRVAELLGLVHQAGLSRVAFVAEPRR